VADVYTGLFINRNELATQLQRPEQYIEADERIAKDELDTRDRKELGIESIETKL